jgi:hypothetical protein
MAVKPDIKKDLHPQYFWDVDFLKLDPDTSGRLIIERVFALGTFEEIKLIIKYYGTSEVLRVLKNLKYLDRKTLNFISVYFKVPPDSFRCYKHKQLNRQHWN